MNFKAKAIAVPRAGPCSVPLIQTLRTWTQWHHVGCWPKGETGQLGPKTSCLYQVLNAFLLIPSFGITAMKDFPFTVKKKKKKPNSYHRCLKQPRCGIQGWGGACDVNGTHNTHTGEKPGQPGKRVRHAMVSFHTGAGQWALGVLPVVFIQHQNMES